MKTKSVIFQTICMLIAANSLMASEQKLYVGSNSSEAIVDFDGAVEFNSTAAKPTLKTAMNAIDSQLEHTVGPITNQDYKAVPKGDHVVSNVKIVQKAAGTFEASYHYKGTMVIENGPLYAYPITLAINPKKIYKRSMVGDKNPCTDDHYQTEGDFWYFWSPDRPGCKLVKDKDYKIVNANFQRIENSKLTYPEYQNLPNEKGIIEIHLLFGLDDPTKDRNPLKSSDVNSYNFRSVRQSFLSRGYTEKVWTDAEVKKIAKRLDGKAPYVETLTKGNISIRMVFAPSGIDEQALGFHFFYKDAIENSSIMIYSGHSGLGGHLDLESIEADLGEKINFNPNKYQIFFFDSCTSYRYYNSQYLDRKITALDPKGTKKLDIFVNGLETLFSVMGTSIDKIAIAVEKSVGMATTGKGFVSYQTLAKQIDTDNLFGIVGDEDNVAPKL